MNNIKCSVCVVNLHFPGIWHACINTKVLKAFSDNSQVLGVNSQLTPPTCTPTHTNHNRCKTVHRAQFGISVSRRCRLRQQVFHSLSSIAATMTRAPKRPFTVIFPVAVYFFFWWGAVGPVQGQRASVSKHSPRVHKYEGRGSRNVCILVLALCPNSSLPSFVYLYPY